VISSIRKSIHLKVKTFHNFFNLRANEEILQMKFDESKVKIRISINFRLKRIASNDKV
jgi:hypothetical protein